MIATIPAQVVKRRGMSALDAQLKVLCVEIAEHEVILHNIGSHDEVYG